MRLTYGSKEKEKVFFSMKMHDYKDFEKCTILRNSELKTMYCFDKDEQSVLIETSDNDVLVGYLQSNYGIEAIKWEPIYDKR